MLFSNQIYSQHILKIKSTFSTVKINGSSLLRIYYQIVLCVLQKDAKNIGSFINVEICTNDLIKNKMFELLKTKLQE